MVRQASGGREERAHSQAHEKNCLATRINVEYYEGVDVRAAATVILPPEPNLADVSGERLLLIDDVADTGHTLKAVHDLCAGAVARSAPSRCTSSRAR